MGPANPRDGQTESCPLAYLAATSRLIVHILLTTNFHQHTYTRSISPAKLPICCNQRLAMAATGVLTISYKISNFNIKNVA